MRSLIDWTQIFPNLAIYSYRWTSCPSDQYNCFAWAAGDDQKRWEPDEFGLFFWPKGVSRELTKKTIVAAYKTIGFKLCADPSLKTGLDKIAIYFVGSEPKHASRQLPSGKWTSKLGGGDDIEHTLDGLNDAGYVSHPGRLH